MANNRGQSSMERIQTINVTNIRFDFYRRLFTQTSNEFLHQNEIHLFSFEHVRYVLNANIEEFVRLPNLDELLNANDLLSDHNGGNGTSEREFL